MIYACQVQNIHWLSQLATCMQLHSKNSMHFADNDIHRSSELNDFLTGNENGNLYMHKCNEYTIKGIAAATTNFM